MKLFETKIECTMADGGELLAIVDQRDVAAFEGSDLYDDEGGRPTVRTRWLAWSALRRAKAVTASWKDFNTELCVQAWAVTEEEEEPADDESLDPSKGA